MKLSILTFISFLFTLNLFSQTIEPGSLWQAEMVYDTLDNKYPKEGIHRFMYFENENEISTLTIYEKINMKDGEMFISYMVEANNLEKKSETEYKLSLIHI